MTITELVRMAKRIHDVEGWDLGSRSSRETRNAFLERVVGCAYWGHPAYNSQPDTQWHCKDPDGPGGRPASDDVVVSMPTRYAYDLIPGAGADGYRFEAHGFDLGPEQFVFVPSKPNGAGFPEPDIPPAADDHKCPVLTVPGYEALGGDAFFREQVGKPLAADYAEAGQAFNDGTAVWFSRTTYVLIEAALKGTTVDMRARRNEWRAALGLPPR
jgi:hypothetical protein